MLADSDQQLMSRMLHRREIPLLSVHALESEEPQIRLSQSSLNGPRPIYVALSHVWSDGLGNPLENSLPKCQLITIQSLVNSLYPRSAEPVPFWIDTLCVPLNGEGRKDAIQGMRRVYEEGDIILVLDASLK